MPRALRTAVRYAVVVGAYVGAAKLGLELSVAHGVITPVWAPTGIALAALVLFGPRLWPAVFVGALIANATSGASFAEATVISAGNTLEALVGVALLRRAAFRPTIDRVRDVLALILLAAAVSTTISATNGVTTLWVGGDLHGSYGAGWLLWWIGDAMGDLVVAPLLVVWAATPLRRLGTRTAIEAVALAGLLVGLSSFVFLAGYWRYPHLLFPLLVWATLRFRQRGAVTSSFVVAAIAIAGAVGGTTPIANGSATAIVQVLEGLLAAVTATMLILGAVLEERSAGETQLARANAALAEAQAVAHIGSWEWSVADDRITWSDELYRVYGLDPRPAAMTYDSFLALVHPDDRDLIRRTVGGALAGARPFAVDHRVVLPDGAVRWVHSRGRTVADDDGRPLRMLGTEQDITERKRVEQLRDNILATVSHELRTPLTSIIGFSTTLAEKGAGLAEEMRTEMVAHIVREARRLERLLSDLLDLDRLRHSLVRPSFRAVDVGALVRQVAAGVAADGRTIAVTAPSVLADVDAPKVERIVENLLANALKHTPPRTEILVRVEETGDSVLVAVDDRGPGVPESERAAIFEIFNRGGGSNARGTGIGLSLVAQFAELHDGRAWVEENPAGGASFRVLLPRRRPR